MAGTQSSPLPLPTATSCRARLRQDICKDICREFCSALCSNLHFGGTHSSHQRTSSYAAPAEVWRRPLERFWTSKGHPETFAASAQFASLAGQHAVSVICRRVAFQIVFGNLRELLAAPRATLLHKLAGRAPLPSSRPVHCKAKVRDACCGATKHRVRLAAAGLL